MSGITVIGAGVVGICSAYSLARRGHSVTVLDAAHEAGRGTSFANGAQLSYAYADALASPKLLRQLPHLLRGRDPAFRLRACGDPDLIGWALRFLSNCTGARFTANTLALLEQTLESQAAMHRLLARHEIEFMHSRPGKLHLYFDRAGFDAARPLLHLKRQFGVRQEALSGMEAVALEPSLRSSAQPIQGAIFSPDEAVGDPYAFCREMTRLLARTYGVTFVFRARVEGLQYRHGAWRILTSSGTHEAARVVIASGLDSLPLARSIGLRLPIQGMKGYSVTARAIASSPRISLTDTKRRLVYCRLGEHVRIAGMAEIGRVDTRLDPERTRDLLDSARAFLPAGADFAEDLSPWCGLRPMTPNGLPLIGATRRPGLFVNVGHGMLGWTLAAGSGERLAKSVARQPG